MNHFGICHDYGYEECLPFLFTAITEHPFLDDWYKRKLTEYYIDLGGRAVDYLTYVTEPAVTEDKFHLAWNWFLIEKLLLIESQLICGLLLKVG